MRYFEDLAVGEEIALGSVTVDEAEMVAFAERYDPQPFHVDADAAAASPFKGLAASGWYTCALFMRLYVDGLLTDTASQGSPGVEELRWLVPVRAGDTLRGRVRLIDARPSSTRPDRATIVNECELINQRDEVVMRLRARGLIGRRTASRA
jgi:acyl dehydratase